jgi:hypothetical protein
MGRILKWLFVGGPIVLLLGVVACQTVDAVRVDAGFADPAGVTWGEGDDAVRVKVTEESGADVETLTVHVEALDARGGTLARRSLDIDQDLWGGGFARAMQVDDDPELEVVAWSAHESNEDCFYFDYADGGVSVHPFSLASESARALAVERHQVHGVNSALIPVLVFLALVYYAALGLVWVFVRAARRARARTAPVGP